MTKLKAHTPHPADIFAGKQLKAKRIILGMNQKEVGDTVGITFQQIQKYEKGINRMGASRIAEFSKVLKVSPGCFFEEKRGKKSTMPSTKEQRRLARLIRNFLTVSDKQQRGIDQLVKALVGQ